MGRPPLSIHVTPKDQKELTRLLRGGLQQVRVVLRALVLLKLAIIVFFVAVGSFYVKPANWTPFSPNGFKGISSAAASIFFGIFPSPLFDLAAHAGNAFAGLF